MKRTLSRVVHAFTKHELWALEMSVRIPALVPLFVGTLMIWWIGPMLLLTPFVIAMIEMGHVVWGWTAVIIVVPIIVPLALWLYLWWFICFERLLGGSRIAEKKRVELQRRLAALDEGKPLTEELSHPKEKRYDQ